MVNGLIVMGVLVCIAIFLMVVFQKTRSHLGGAMPESEERPLLTHIEKYKAILQRDPSSREFLQLATLYQKLGIAEEAMKVLQQGLQHHPNNLEARLAIARLELAQGHIEHARHELQEVVRQDTQHVLAHKLLGEIALQRQQYEEAVTHFGASYAVGSDDRELKVMLDYLSSILGRDVLGEIEAADTNA